MFFRRIGEHPLAVDLSPLLELTETGVVRFELEAFVTQAHSMGAVFRQRGAVLTQLLVLDPECLGFALELLMFGGQRAFLVCHRSPQQFTYAHGVLMHGDIHFLHEHDDPAAVLRPSHVRKGHAQRNVPSTPVGRVEMQLGRPVRRLHEPQDGLAQLLDG